MNKITLLAGAACLFSFNASAIDVVLTPYVGAKAKFVLSHNRAETKGAMNDHVNIDDEILGGSLTAGVVHPLSKGDVRFELEYTKNANAVKSVDKQLKVRSESILFNVYYDFDIQTKWPVKPYVTAGLGWGNSDFTLEDTRKKSDSFAWQVGLGATYDLTDHTSFDLGYRYIDYGKYNETYDLTSGETKVDYKPRAHEFLLGIRYTF